MPGSNWYEMPLGGSAQLSGGSCSILHMSTSILLSGSPLCNKETKPPSWVVLHNTAHESTHPALCRVLQQWSTAHLAERLCVAGMESHCNKATWPCSYWYCALPFMIVPILLLCNTAQEQAHLGELPCIAVMEGHSDTRKHNHAHEWYYVISRAHLSILRPCIVSKVGPPSTGHVFGSILGF